MSYRDLMRTSSLENRKELSGKVRSRVEPPPDLKVSEWAERHRILSQEASPLPGRFRFDNAPYLLEICDAVCDHRVTEVVVCSASQVGKTETLLNVIGYFIDQDPSPILLVLPHLELAESWSKDRLAPMIRDTECLRDKVKDARSRDAENTILHKKFPGGHITLAGSNSPASLASRPIRIVLFDEVSKFATSAGGEGDPISLAKKRAMRFYNKKFVEVSSPANLATCRITLGYEHTDKRKFYVPCPHCGMKQTLDWEQMRWEPGNPDSARLLCKNQDCLRDIRDGDKPAILRKGEWIAERQSTKRGYHVSALYAIGVRFAELVSEFEEAKGRPELMRVFVNTILGLPWEESEAIVEHHLLYMRREKYTPEEVPAKVLAITAGVDVQDDRLCIEIVGWGYGEESWSLEYLTLWGDPGKPDVWLALDDVRRKRFRHASGISMKVAAVAIDSGGHHTQQVYDYARTHVGERVFAIKGFEGAGRALVGPPSPRKTGLDERHVDLFPVGVDGAKALIYSRLNVVEAGPGCCHFPMTAHYPERYFEELTSERVVVRYANGFPVKKWVLPSGKRNEPLDCRVYALAALQVLDPVWEAIEARIEQRAAQAGGSEEPKKPKPKRRSSGQSWATNW